MLAGNQATPQSDLYALGVTLLWALIGRPPFQARTLDEPGKEVERRPLSAVSRFVVRPRGLVDAIESAIDQAPPPGPGVPPTWRPACGRCSKRPAPTNEGAIALEPCW